MSLKAGMWIDHQQVIVVLVTDVSNEVRKFHLDRGNAGQTDAQQFTAVQEIGARGQVPEFEHVEVIHSACKRAGRTQAVFGCKAGGERYLSHRSGAVSMLLAAFGVLQLAERKKNTNCTPIP